MSVQVKWERRPFWSGQEAQIYPLNYLLLLPTYRGNVNYYKSVHHPIPTLPVGKGAPWQFFLKISKLSFQSFQLHFLLAQTEGERKAYFAKLERTWSSMKNLCSVDRFQDLSKVLKKKIFWGIWYCHTDHALLESSSWYGSTKVLN